MRAKLISLRRLLSSMHVDVAGALSDLARIVDRMAELLEWRRLARQEQRRPFATSFDLGSHVEGELQSLQIAFLDAEFSLRELLERSDFEVSPARRRTWLRELDRLRRRASRIVHTARFINP